MELVVHSDVTDLDESLGCVLVGGFEEDDSLLQASVYGEVLACSRGKCCS